MKAKGIILIKSKYLKEHTKEVTIAGDISKVEIVSRVTDIKLKDFPNKCKDFEIKRGKIQKKVKEKSAKVK